MTTWFRPTLAADIQAAVLADRDQHPDPVVRRKTNVLWTVHLGHSREDAARLAHVGVATAKRYVIAYRDGGLDGLKYRENPRRPTSDLAAYAALIWQLLTEHPVRTTAEAPTSAASGPSFGCSSAPRPAANASTSSAPETPSPDNS